jgi:transposase InsO family protein
MDDEHAAPAPAPSPPPQLSAAYEAAIRRCWDDLMPGSLLHRYAELFAHVEAGIPRLREALAAGPDDAAAVERWFEEHCRKHEALGRVTPAYNHARLWADALKRRLGGLRHQGE